jgi:hypothetical protein
MNRRSGNLVGLVVSVLSVMALIVPVSASAQVRTQSSPPKTIQACIPPYLPHFGVTITPEYNSVIYDAWGPSRVDNIDTTIYNSKDVEVWNFTDDSNVVVANLGLTNPGIWSPTPHGSTYGRFTIITDETTTCNQRVRIVDHYDNFYGSGGEPES